MGSATARTTWLKNVSLKSYVACARCSWDGLRRVSHGVSFGPTCRHYRSVLLSRAGLAHTILVEDPEIDNNFLFFLLLFFP